MIDWSKAPEWANYAVKNHVGVSLWANHAPEVNFSGIVSYNNINDDRELLIEESLFKFDIPNSFVVPRLTNTSQPKNALQTQEGGSHYKNLKIQPVEYIHANNLDYLQGNVVKYVTRHKDKNGAEDIKKTIHYCQLILQLQYGIYNTPMESENEQA